MNKQFYTYSWAFLTGISACLGCLMRRGILLYMEAGVGLCFGFPFQSAEYLQHAGQSKLNIAEPYIFWNLCSWGFFWFFLFWAWHLDNRSRYLRRCLAMILLICTIVVESLFAINDFSFGRGTILPFFHIFFLPLLFFITLAWKGFLGLQYLIPSAENFFLVLSDKYYGRVKK